MAKYEPSTYVVGRRVRGESLSQFGGSATRLVAVALSGRAVVASFASAALGWRLVAAFRVVVLVQRVRRVVELACLVVGEPSGVPVARIREDLHGVVLVGGSRARRVSAVGLLLGGQRRTVALSVFDVDRGRLLGDRLLLAGWAGGRSGCGAAG
jgi:hypothetical protein